MKNKEKYVDFIAKAFADVDADVCGFRKEHVLKQKSCRLVGCVECGKRTAEWLEQEYQESPILDEKEKEYLNAVIRPWRDKVESIVKKLCFEFGYIVIQYRDDMGYTSTVILPNFPKGTMYKGMELNKDYTLEDLGL